MTTLTLTQVAIAPADDLTDILMLGQNAEVVFSPSRSTTRAYANGRFRNITRPGLQRQVTVTFPYMSRDNYRSLEDLLNQTVLLRDQRQRRVWGVIDSVTGNEFPVRDLVQSVQFTLTEVTVSEVV